MVKCTKCGTELSEEIQYCPVCGNQQFPDPPQENPELPMRWYRFVIRFQLFAAALFSVVNALNLFSGRVFGIKNSDGLKAVYRVYPELKPLAIIAGIMYLGVAAYDLFVRQQLAEYRKNAPMLYIISIVVSILPYLVFTIGESVVTEGGLGDITGYAAVVIVLAMLYANYVYFSKRKHMFVN